MEQDFIIEYYTKEEVKDLIKKNEHLYYLDNGIEEVMIREQDIPDAIVSINRNVEPMNLKFFDTQNLEYKPVLTTYGEYLNRADPILREKIIERLVELQTTDTKPNTFKVIDEDMYDSIQSENELKKENKEQEENKTKEEKEKNKDNKKEGGIR